MGSTDETGRKIFVSDVHLYFGGESYQETFLRFLKERAAGAAELYIHGDLFDFYLGPKQGRLPFYAPLFDALAALSQEGTKVVVLHGNRDFLMGRHFRKAGVEVIPEDTELRVGDQSVRISHGDEYCIHDRSYQFWARGVLRAGLVRFIVRNLPVWAGVGLARSYRRVSQRKHRRHQKRETGRLPTILDGVHQLLEKRPFDVVICGHIHWLADTEIQEGERRCRLLTTGAWEESPNYIEWAGGEFRIWQLTEKVWSRFA